MAINERELADLVNLRPTQHLDAFKGVKKLPVQEYFTSGHRTCGRSPGRSGTGQLAAGRDHGLSAEPRREPQRECEPGRLVDIGSGDRRTRSGLRAHR